MIEIVWIVVADASRARVFQCVENGRAFAEVEDFAHPEGRARAADLKSDAMGRYFGKGERSQGHAAAPDTDPVEHENDVFARTLAAHLDQAHQQGRFGRLWIVAAPKFLGRLRKEFSGNLASAIDREVDKDLSGMSARDIQEHLFASAR